MLNTHKKYLQIVNMFSLFYIIKQFIFFSIIFIAFHFTYNYFRNLFLSKRDIFTPSEKYDEINEILQNPPPILSNNETSLPPPPPLPSNDPPSLVNSEIQSLEKETAESVKDSILISSTENVLCDSQAISSIDY